MYKGEMTQFDAIILRINLCISVLIKVRSSSKLFTRITKSLSHGFFSFWPCIGIKYSVLLGWLEGFEYLNHTQTFVPINFKSSINRKTLSGSLILLSNSKLEMFSWPEGEGDGVLKKDEDKAGFGFISKQFEIHDAPPPTVFSIYNSPYL